MPDTREMIPVRAIRDRNVAEFATRAEVFLASHAWCRKITEGHLAWAIAGVLGVFLFKLVPARAGVDDTLWVVVGDLPPAYLVCDDAANWHEALDGYCYEMQRWVKAVRARKSLKGVIPVNAEPTREWADKLSARLAFFRKNILSRPRTSWESDV